MIKSTLVTDARPEVNDARQASLLPWDVEPGQVTVEPHRRPRIRGTRRADLTRAVAAGRR